MEYERSVNMNLSMSIIDINIISEPLSESHEEFICSYFAWGIKFVHQFCTIDSQVCQRVGKIGVYYYLRKRKTCIQIEGSETPEFSVSLSTKREDNKEQESTHSKNTVYKTVTIPATGSFDWDDAIVEIEILKEKVITTKDKREKRVLESMCKIVIWSPLHWMSNQLQRIFSPPNISGGNYNYRNNNYKSIKEMLCGKTDNIKEFTERCNEYNMSDALTITYLV